MLCCGGGPTSPGAIEDCSGYPDWATSPYALPFAAGSSYKVIQGNCSPPGNGHRGANRYAYDFGMAIGTPIIASRSGTVIEIEESHSDGQVAATGFDNFIVIAHHDGSTALYGHLTHDGAVPSIGAAVSKGEG